MYLKKLIISALLILGWSVMAASDKPDQGLLIGLRSNLLYDAVLIPNIGAEIAIPDNWSVSIEGEGAWWSGTSHHRSWRFVGLELTGRRYFPRHGRPLTGHHAGIYFQICSYDFKFGEKGYIGGSESKKIFNHPTLGVGLEYGYTFAVTKWLSFDASIGLGWSHGRTVEYKTYDGHDVWLRTVRRNWYGPTRAAFSIIYRIGYRINRQEPP